MLGLLSRIVAPVGVRAGGLCSVGAAPPLGLLRLRASLDDLVCGHAELKDALLLALVAREHVYVEGTPGTAKTLLAEGVARGAGLRQFVYQMHRDTRLHELVGDAVITRQRGEGGEETIRQSTRPGGILTCELAVLDDISRAPGEALNVLFRVLNERRFASAPSHDAPLPLVAAIATGNPLRDGEGDGYYAEALDPASLDRFTLHCKASGLIEGRAWEDVRRVIALHDGAPRGGAPGPAAGVEAEAQAAAALRAAHAELPRVRLGPELPELLVELLQALVAACDGGGAFAGPPPLLTDRTFLGKAPLLCRANALLHGREACTPDDLAVVRHLTAFRVPEHVHERVGEIVDDVLARAARRRAEAAAAAVQRAEGGDSHGRGSGGGGGGGGGGGDAAGAGSRDDGVVERPPGDDVHAAMRRARVEPPSGAATADDTSPAVAAPPPPDTRGAGGDEGASAQRPGEGGADPAFAPQLPPPSRAQLLADALADAVARPIVATHAALDRALRSCAAALAHAGAASGRAGSAPPDTRSLEERLASARHVAPLVHALSGRIARRARRASGASLQPAGSAAGLPCGWRASASLASVCSADAEAAASARWVAEPTPALPPRVARRSSARGGRLAVVRDVSASMQGARALWASAVVTRLVRMCRARALAVGLCDFAHAPTLMRAPPAARRVRGGSTARDAAQGGPFFHRDYAALLAAAQTRWSDGGTNIELALRATLEEHRTGRRPRAAGGRAAGEAAGAGAGALAAGVASAWTALVQRWQPPAPQPSRSDAARLRGAPVTGGQAAAGPGGPDASEADESASRLALAAHGARRPSPGGGHILLVTDGEPTAGSTTLHTEQARARALGVSVHTVYIGDEGRYPLALSHLARATGGVRFQAVIDRSTGDVRLVER